MMVYTCAVCDKQFLRWHSLQMHRRIHSQHRPYHCNHRSCVKSFSRLSSLQSHRRTHLDRRPYQCRECQTKFLFPRHWKQHRCRMHRARPHSCRFCALKFARILSLSYHIQKHHACHSSRYSQTNWLGEKEKITRNKSAADSKKVLLKITAGKSMTILTPSKLISHESRKKRSKKSKKKRKRDSRSPTPNGIILSFKRGSVKLPDKKKSTTEKAIKPDLNGMKTSIKFKDLKLRIKTYPEISVSPKHEDPSTVNPVHLPVTETTPKNLSLKVEENSENNPCEDPVETSKLMNGIKIVKDKSGKLSSETLKSVKQKRKERENVFESFRDVGIWKVMPSPRPDRVGSDILKLKLSPQKPIKSDLSVADTGCSSARFLQIPDKPKADLSGEESDILELPMPTYDKESDNALNNVNDSGIEVLSSSSCNRSNGNSVRSVAMDENSPSYNFTNEDSLLSLDSPYGDGHNKSEHSICPKCGGVVLESNNNTRSPGKCRCNFSNPNSPFQTPISPVKLSDICKPPDSLDIEQGQNSPNFRTRKSNENPNVPKEGRPPPTQEDAGIVSKSSVKNNANSDSENSDIMIISVGDKLPPNSTPEKSFKGKLKLKLGSRKSAVSSVRKTSDIETKPDQPNSENVCENEQPEVNKQRSSKKNSIKVPVTSPKSVPVLGKTNNTMTVDIKTAPEIVETTKSIIEGLDASKAVTTPNKTILSARYGTVHSPVVVDDSDAIQDTNESKKKLGTPNKLSQKKPLFKSKSKPVKKTEAEENKITNLQVTETKAEEESTEVVTEKVDLLSDSVAALPSNKRPLFKKSVSVEDTSDIVKKKPLFKRRKTNTESSPTENLEHVKAEIKPHESDVKSLESNVKPHDSEKGAVDLTENNEKETKADSNAMAKDKEKKTTIELKSELLVKPAAESLVVETVADRSVDNNKQDNETVVQNSDSKSCSKSSVVPNYEKDCNKITGKSTISKTKLSESKTRKKAGPKSKTRLNSQAKKSAVVAADEDSLAELYTLVQNDNKDTKDESKDPKREVDDNDQKVDGNKDHNDSSEKKSVQLNVEKANSSEKKSSDSSVKSPLDLFQQQFLSFLSGTKVAPKTTVTTDKPEHKDFDKFSDNDDSFEPPMFKDNKISKENSTSTASGFPGADSFSWLKIFGETDSSEKKSAEKKAEEEAADVMKDLTDDLASINKKMDVSDDDTNSLDMGNVFGESLSALEPKPVENKQLVQTNSLKVTCNSKPESKHGGPYKRKQTAKRTGAKVRTIKKKVELDFTYENESSDSGDDKHSFIDSDPDFNPTYSDDDFVTKPATTKRRPSRACMQMKKRRTTGISSGSDNDSQSELGDLSDAASRSSQTRRTKQGRRSSCPCCIGEPGKVLRTHSKECSRGDSRKAYRLPKNSKQFIRNTLRLLQLQEKIHSLFLTLFPDCAEMIAGCRIGTDDFDSLIEDVLSGLEEDKNNLVYPKVVESSKQDVLKTEMLDCAVNNIGLPFTSPESVSRASEIDFAAVEEKVGENHGFKSDCSPNLSEQHYVSSSVALGTSSTTSLKFENNTLADSSCEDGISPYKDPHLNTCTDTPVKAEHLTQESSKFHSSVSSTHITVSCTSNTVGLCTTTDSVNQSYNSAFSSCIDKANVAGLGEARVETVNSLPGTLAQGITSDARLNPGQLDLGTLQPTPNAHMPYNPSELYSQDQQTMPLVQITIDLDAAKVSLCKTPKDCMQRLHSQIIKLTQLLLPELDLKNYFYRNVDNLEFLLDLLIEANAGREVKLDDTNYISENDCAQTFEDPLMLGDNEAITYNFIPIVTDESARLSEGEQLLIPCNDLFKEQIKSQRESLKRDLFAIDEDHPVHGSHDDAPNAIIHNTLTSLNKIAQQRQSPRKRSRDGRPRKRSADEKRTLFVQEKLNNTHNSTFVCTFSKHEELNKETSISKQKHPQNSKEHFLSNLNLGDKLMNGELSESEQNAVNEKLLKLTEIVEGSNVTAPGDDSVFRDAEDDLFKRTAADKNIFELMLPS